MDLPCVYKGNWTLMQIIVHWKRKGYVAPSWHIKSTSERRDSDSGPILWERALGHVVAAPLAGPTFRGSAVFKEVVKVASPCNAGLARMAVRIHLSCLLLGLGKLVIFAALGYHAGWRRGGGAEGRNRRLHHARCLLSGLYHVSLWPSFCHR